MALARVVVGAVVVVVAVVGATKPVWAPVAAAVVVNTAFPASCVVGWR